VTNWAPNVKGTVNSIAFNGTDCSHAYIGGKFTAVGSTAVKNIAEIDTATGSVVTAFRHSASARVETLSSYDSHIIVGGYFTSINGSSADPFMASLSPVTGKNDGFIHLGISGHYQYSGVRSNTTNIYNQAFSHSGTLDLVMGDFTSVGGLPRQQIFMLNLATTPCREVSAASARGGTHRTARPSASSWMSVGICAENHPRSGLSGESARFGDHGGAHGRARRLVDEDHATGHPVSRIRIAEDRLGQPQSHPAYLIQAKPLSGLIPVQ
jgi:hypothetical protein